jgi:hypothetical protein
MRFSLLIALAIVLATAGCTVSVATPSSSPSEQSDGGIEGGFPSSGDAAASDALSGVEASGSLDARADAPDAQEAGPFVPVTHSPWPQVPSNQGIFLKPMKLVTIVSSGDPLTTQLFAFGDALIASHWWTSVTTEYGLGTPSGGVHVTGAAITQNPDQTAMISYIQSAIAGNAAAAPDGNTVFMLYLPPNIDGIDPMNGTNTMCKFFGGFHDVYDMGGNAFAVGQRCPLQGTGLTEIQDLTITASHEILEAATDPQPGSGWALGAGNLQQPWTQPPTLIAPGGELGDLCLGTQWAEGGYTYQRGWSNAAAAAGGDPCVPAYPSAKYYNASAPQPWYMVTAGGSVTIPLTGFASGPTGDWALETLPLSSSSTDLSGSVTSATNYVGQRGMTVPTTNNGRMATLTVSAPGAASGSWTVFGIASVPLPATGMVGGDAYHLWPVGVYVP